MWVAAAAKSLQSCTTLCDPRDGSPPGSAVPGILQARTLEWVAISFSNAWKWKVKGKSLSHVQLFATPWTATYQAPTSMGFSRQEYWSGLPLPSPKCGLRYPKILGLSLHSSLQFFPNAIFMFYSFSSSPHPKCKVQSYPCWSRPHFLGRYLFNSNAFFFLIKMVLFILWFQYLWLTTQTSLLCFPSSKPSLFQITHILIPIILLRIIMYVLKVNHVSVLITKHIIKSMPYSSSHHTCPRQWKIRAAAHT